MSIGGGGGTTVKEKEIEPRVYKPEFYETPRQWVAPPAEVLSQQVKDIGQQAGYGFGNRNMFGSGAMGEAIARRIGESAVRGTRREDKGQYIAPQVVTPSTRSTQTTAPKWSYAYQPSGGSGGSAQ